MMEENGLPKGWVETTLGEVVDKMYSGGTPSTKRDDYYNGNIPWIRTQEVTFNRISDTEIKITELGLKNSSARYIPINTVIVAMYGNSAGRVAISKIEATTNQACCNIVVNPLTSTAEYIFYNLLNRYVEIKGKANGAAQQNLNVGILRNLEISLPPLPEQKAIASILTSFDDKIELLQAQNETLETIAQTIFKEWFENKSESWEYRKIGDLLEVTSSKRIFHNEYVSSGIPFYRSKEIIELSTKPDITTELFISEERYKRIKEKFDVPQKGDILLTAVGTLGVPFQVRDNSEFYFKDGNLIWFKNFNDIASSDFVYNWLKLKSTQRNLNIISIGSTQKALTINSIQNMQIPFLTDYESRIKFNSLLKSNLNKVNHNLTHIQTLQATRDTLLPKLMSGQLRVAEFQEQLCEVM